MSKPFADGQKAPKNKFSGFIDFLNF